MMHAGALRAWLIDMTQRFDLRRINALEHNLSEMFGSPERYGIRLPVPAGIMAEAGKVVLGIAGADGRVSDKEREAFVNILRSYGAPEEDIRAIQTFTPTSQGLETLVSQGPPPFLRCLVYDAIRVAKVDGFHAKERETTERVVKKLGLEHGLVAACEALIRIEDSVNAARERLLDPPRALPQGWETPRTNAGLEARGATFGSGGAITLPREFHLAMCKAVLAIASADGDLSDTELTWWAGFARTLGTPVDVLEEALKVDYQSVAFEQVFDMRLKPYARVAIYSAVKAARADGVTTQEEIIAQRAAERLGLNNDFVNAVLGQLEVESGVREARINLLAPLR